MNVFELFEAKKKSLKNPADNPCWTGYHPVGTKQKSGRTVPNCVPNEGVAEEASPMIKPPANRFDNKQEAFAYAKEHGGKVFKSTYINPNNGMKNVCFVVKAESDVAEASNAAQQAAIAIAKKKEQGVAEVKHQPRWEVEQRTAGHHNAFYIVRGYDRPREVWKDARGMSDFRSRAAAEAKAEELNSQQVDEAGGSFMAAGHYNNMIFQQNLNNLGQQLSRLSPEDLEHFNQIAAGVGIGSVAGVAGVIGAVTFGDMFMSVMRRTMSAAKKKVSVDTEEIIKLRRQIVSIHKRLATLKTEPAIAKYQAMLKQAYEVLAELEARQGNQVAEAFQDDGKMDWDAWKQKAKQHGAVKFVDTDNKTIAYDKNSKQVSSITWSSKKKGVAEGKSGSDKYIKLLKNHDWTYDYGDDQEAQRGYDERQVLLRLAKKLDPKFKIWNKYAPDDTHKKNLSKPKDNYDRNDPDNWYDESVAEGKPQKRADRYHINKDGKPASLASYADRDSAVKDRDAKYPDAKVHQVGPRGKVKGEFEEGMAENWGEPLTGWHVVYARTGNKVSGTPDFDSRDSAQKYLMTKMSANHHNYRVAHADNLGTSAPTPMGGYLEEIDDDDHGYLPTNLKLGAYRDEWDPRDYSAYPDEFKSNEQLREIVYNMVNEGVEPTVEVVFPTILTATQDWLADDRYRDGDPVFEEYEDHPVVLKLDGEYYILDGHHRCSRALAAKRFVKIYMFVAPQGVAEGEPIQELSSDALDRYKVKAKKSADELTSQGKYRQANDRTMNVMKATGKQIDKTVTNIRNALNRESANQGVVEAGYAGADDTDTVGFYLDTERAYQAVMGRYGDMIDHDETSGIMYVPSRLWPKIEMIAFDADGIGALRDDDLENPEHYGIAEAAVMESRLQEMRAAGYDIL